MVVVNWCGHGQEFVPWPDADGYWTLVPVVEAVANRLRTHEAPEDPGSTATLKDFSVADLGSGPRVKPCHDPKALR